MKNAIIIFIAFLISVQHAKAEKITVDSKGNVYLLGLVQDSITFSDSTTIVTNSEPWSSPKTYLVKLDPVGNVVWYKLFDQNDENYFDIKVDHADHLLLASLVTGTIALDSLTIIQDIFRYLIARFDPDGNLLWYNLSSKGASGYGVSIAIDEQDNIYTAGLFTGNFHFHGLDTIAGSYPTYRPFVAKFDSSGHNSWLQKIDSWSIVVADIDVDDSGNVMLVGHFNQSIIHQGDTLSAGEGWDGFWMKFDTHGVLLKMKRIYSTGYDMIDEVGVGKNGQFSYSGYFQGDTLFIDDFSPTINVSPEAVNFVANVNYENSEAWLFDFNGACGLRCYGVEMDTANTIYLYTLREEFIYNSSLNDFVGADISESNYLIKMDSAGKLLCFLKLNNGQISDAAILEDGTFYVVGKFENTLTLNGTTYTQLGNTIFIASFDVNCNTTWTSLVSNPLGTGINEISNQQNGISIFPNPATHQTSLSFNDHTSKSGKIIVYTMEGTKKMELEFSEKEFIELDI
ncbi:MAG: hypothetical protein WBP41_08205, partial [Saprospiraceae bacterium]